MTAGMAMAHHHEDGPGAAAALPPGSGGPAPAAEGGEGGGPPKPVRGSTGEGSWVFRLSEELSALPDGARRFIPGAHGGFAVDWRGKRDVYFALKGCGIIRMSADLRQKEIIELDPFLRQGNFHNTTLLYDGKGTAHIALPDDEKQRVYIVTTAGKLIQVLDHPRGNEYYDGWGPFVPTDVEQVPNLDIFIVTGYSPGDYVVSANPFTGAWNKLIFGGKGNEHGKFGTGHGITWNPEKSTLDISDRPNSRIESFDVQGNYKGTVALPAGALPCDVDFLDGTLVIGCLNGPGGSTPAPIYITDREGKILSTLKPKEDLGLGLFDHVHNATWHAVGEGDGRKVYILAQAWNPGGFAVLERVAK